MSMARPGEFHGLREAMSLGGLRRRKIGSSPEPWRAVVQCLGVLLLSGGSNMSFVRPDPHLRDDARREWSPAREAVTKVTGDTSSRTTWLYYACVQVSSHIGRHKRRGETQEQLLSQLRAGKDITETALGSFPPFCAPLPTRDRCLISTSWRAQLNQHAHQALHRTLTNDQ